LGHAVIFALLVCLTACGGQRDDDASVSTGEVPGAPLVGTYTMDVARTTAGMTKDADGNDVEVSPEVLRRVQAGQGASDFRLELHAEHTFVYVVPMGKDTWTTGGTWQEKDGALVLTTTTVGGKPAPDEMAITETYAREGAFLVMEQDDRRIYLARQSDAK